MEGLQRSSIGVRVGTCNGCAVVHKKRSIRTHARRLGSVESCVVLLFLLCRPVLAHKDVLAVSLEPDDITIKGDFSDWP